MHKYLTFLIFLLLVFGCKHEEKPKAPLLSNLGKHHFPVTTNSALAQKYFDQGIILAYGFNHEEAFRSFEEAARLDSNCAMAYWGMAIVLGPNINLPMDKASVPDAYQAIQKAKSHLENVTERERDWILALSERYSNKPLDVRKKLDSAYSDAMRNLTKKYPNDLDAATMFAESIIRGIIG